MGQTGNAPEEGGRILAVDDTPSNLRLLINLLSRQGHIVHPAASGQAALRFLDITLPDLVLLDAVMPGMDGYQVAERLKANERTRDIPIIFISAASQPLDKVKAFGCGAVDYIVKPFQSEEVVVRIATHLALRRLQEAEHQARLDAEMANRAKSTFLASMSHELRTPLNAILGYAQILKRNKHLSPQQWAGLDTIQQSGEHLLTLIDDILDLSRIEAGRVELYPEAIVLSRFLRLVADIIQVRAEQKGLDFIFEAARDLPSIVRVDPQRLRQILLNLLGNAVKFTDHGQVSLRVFALPADDGAAKLRFEVGDTGPGIDPAQHEVIFQPFEQVGEVRRRAGGTGLGLAISRQMVRQMGSDIQVSSTLGQGSIFWFDLTLPIAKEEEVSPTPTKRVIAGYRGPHRKILVADDAEANRAMLADLLTQVGFEVEQAANGGESVAKVEAAAPDLVIMDITMPVMDGLEAMRRIHRLPGREQLPLIAVSAGALPEERTQSLAAGASAFMVKPIDPSRLLEEIGAQLKLSWEYEWPLEPAPRPRLDQEDLLAPPREEMEILHHLARTGNMRDICARADHLITLDERYRPFADRLRELAAGYQSKAIFTLVGKYMDGDPGG